MPISKGRGNLHARTEEHGQVFTVEHPQVIRNSHSQQLHILAAKDSSQQFAEEGIFGQSLHVKDEAYDSACNLQGCGTFLVTVNFDAEA